MKRLQLWFAVILVLLVAGGGALPAAHGEAVEPEETRVLSADAFRAIDGQVAKLVATDGQSGDWFGYSLAADGDTAVVGAAFATYGGYWYVGAAYVFAQDQGGANAWGQVAKLSPPTMEEQAYFGHSVSISGDTIVVGAPQMSVGGNADQGAAYVFYRDLGGPDGWGLAGTLTPGDGAAFDEFGASVSVDGDTAVVGAYYADPEGMANGGAAYVYSRDEGGTDAWGQIAKLVADDGAESDWLGMSAAVSGDTAVVGAYSADVEGRVDQGAAYVYMRDEGGADAWGQVAKITAADGGAGDGFGYRVALSGDTAVIGAWWANVGECPDQGAAWVFYRDQGGAGAWGEVAKLTALDGAGGDNFGSVAVSGDIAVVGAEGADPGGRTNAGAAYVYYRDEGGVDQWDQAYKLTAGDGLPGDHFGASASAGGTLPIVGADYANVDGREAQGAAYVLEVPDQYVYLPLVLGQWPPGPPGAPTLYPIQNPYGEGTYTVSWSNAWRGDGYVVEEDDHPDFSSPVEVFNFWGNSTVISGKEGGTFYYRAASWNGYGTGPWSNVESTQVNPGGWGNLLITDFEGEFPGPWEVVDNDGSQHGEYLWAKRDCQRHAGGYGGWGVGGGAQGTGLWCGANYPDYADSWMVYGPFSLEGAHAADLTFELRLNSELYHDGFLWLASVDGSGFYGSGGTGDSGGWLSLGLDLADVPDYGSMLGKPQVWVALVFVSDSSGSLADGAHVDDILLRRHLGPVARGGTPAPTLPDGFSVEPAQRSLLR